MASIDTQTAIALEVDQGTTAAALRRDREAGLNPPALSAFQPQVTSPKSGRGNSARETRPADGFDPYRMARVNDASEETQGAIPECSCKLCLCAIM